MTLALIITNISLTIAIVIVVVVLLADMAKDRRPIVIKEAKALRDYYEGRLKDIGINIKNNGLYTITDICGEEKKKWRK